MLSIKSKPKQKKQLLLVEHVLTNVESVEQNEHMLTRVEVHQRPFNGTLRKGTTVNDR